MTPVVATAGVAITRLTGGFCTVSIFSKSIAFDCLPLLAEDTYLLGLSLNLALQLTLQKYKVLFSCFK